MDKVCIICHLTYAQHYKMNDGRYGGSFTDDGVETDCYGFACDDGTCPDCKPPE